MDITQIYNGPHLQRTKRFTRSPRHSLQSSVQIDWQQSLQHDELSPVSRIKKKHTMEVKQMENKYNSFVDQYLTKNLNLTDSRVIKYRQQEQKCEDNSQRRSFSSVQANINPQKHDNSEFKLPKIQGQTCSGKNSILSSIISDRNKNYFNRMLTQRLKKYDFQDKV